MLFENVWFKDVLYKDVLFEVVWFEDVLYKDVLFEDVWFKDVLYKDVYLSSHLKMCICWVITWCSCIHCQSDLKMWFKDEG